uniref:beta strand repeat-containing protein n=2 Tax=Pseudomonas viridiflava TaxID=33069 RepID=UPI0013DFAC91
DFTLGSTLENITLTGSSAINATGNALANILDGSQNTAANVLSGGKGNDIYIVGAGDTVVETLAVDGIDLVRSSVDFELGDNIENLTLTGSSNLDGTGNSLANIITGNDANNILNGLGGADTLIGGKGDDTYVVQLTATNTLQDTVTELAGQGTDTLQVTGGTGGRAAVTLALAATLENLDASQTEALLNLTGNASNNILTGNAGANVLNGGLGADTLIGGQGNDIYVIDNTLDVITEDSLAGTDTVNVAIATAGSSYTLGENLENATLTNAVAFNLTGNELDNILIGNAAANRIDGGAGADLMNGGAGNDTYVVDDIADQIIDTAGIDTVESSVDFTLGSTLENITLTGSNAINATGNALANTLDGSQNTAANVLSGGKGNDIYIVGAGDTVVETLAVDGIDLVRSSVDFELGDNIENLTLLGNANVEAKGNDLANILIGNDGNNRLDGLEGIDTLIGGKGDDTYAVDLTATNALQDKITELASEGNDTLELFGGVSGRAAVTLTLAANLENLDAHNTEPGVLLNLTGNAVANVITGNSSANILDGGLGTDTLIGGDGDDIYVVDENADLIVESDSGGIDTVRSTAAKYRMADNLENLVLIGTGNIKAQGNELANHMTGNSGNNFLDGFAGADTYEGGKGDDGYVIELTDNNQVIDVIIEKAGEGRDFVEIWGGDSSMGVVNITLAANLEDADASFSESGVQINITGNALANDIIGNDANNILDGGAGADTLAGGAGDDTYIVDNAADIVTELLDKGTDTVNVAITTVGGTYKLGNNIENAALNNTIAFNLTGNALGNVLTGNNAANILDGGLGTDTLIGGNGNDTYIVDENADIIIESANGGIDTVRSTAAKYRMADNLENLVLIGTGNIKAQGNDLANHMTGNSGNNFLDGFAGADTYEGGKGDDGYVIELNDNNQVIDVIIEKAGEGQDFVEIWGGDSSKGAVNITLAANLEDADASFSESGVQINITGNALANNIIGNDANNILDGGAGADTLAGGAGNDTYIVDSAADSVTELADEGTDTVNVAITTAGGTYTLGANVENATLTNTVAFNLVGNALDNILTGNNAANVLTGGLGSDTFVFNLTQLGNTNTTRDTITDFQSGTDRIDLTQLGDFTLIASDAAFTGAGQLKLTDGILYGTTDAGSAADFSIKLTGVNALSQSDFISVA